MKEARKHVPVSEEGGVRDDDVRDGGVHPQSDGGAALAEQAAQGVADGLWGGCVGVCWGRGLYGCGWDGMGCYVRIESDHVLSMYM
jgi:hypothetical protein